MTRAKYRRLAGRSVPRSPVLTNAVKAYVCGGTVCVLGQLVIFAAEAIGASRKDAVLCGSLALMLLAVILTGLNVFDRIAGHAGAGTLVPITGFANAVCAPAIEFRTEGMVFGVGTKMFAIAGPVIVYGTCASVVYGIFLWVAGMM